jgi:hypothetical protein
MNRRDLLRLVKKYGGYIDKEAGGEVARFPSPHLKDEFLAELNERERDERERQQD